MARSQEIKKDEKKKSQKTLKEKPWDVVIADYRLPQFSAPAALAVLRESGLDIPLIVVSGTISEDQAVELMRSGAHDYIMKDKLVRLAAAARREVAEAMVRRERKNAEDSLKESEARYRRIVDTATEGVWMMDENYITTFVNERMAQMLGYTGEEMPGKPVDSFMFEEDLQDHAGKMAVRQQGGSGRYERRFRRKDGSTLWTIVSATALTDAQGAFRGSFGMFTDITDRKQAEESLLLEKQRLAMITDNSPYGLVFIGDDDTFEYINPKFTEIFGYDLNDVPNGKEWFRKAFPDGQYRKEVISAWLGDLERAKPGEKRPRVFNATCKDGTEKVIKFIPVGLGTGQNIMTCQDITRLKEAEDNLIRAAGHWRTTFDSIADPIMILDNDFKIIRANRAAASLAGIPIEKVPGNHCYAIMHHADRPLEMCPHAKMLETKEHSGLEVYFDEMKKWFFITVDPMFDDTGNLIGAVHIMKDMTERRTMEERIRKSEENYRSIFDNSVEGIFQTTPEGRFISANFAQAKIFGYDSPQELMERINDIGRQHYVNPEERDIYRDTLDKEGVIRGFEVQLVKKDGSHIWVSLSARVARDDKGAAIYYEGTAEDITARKRAEDDLRESVDHLKSALEGIVEAISMAVEVRDPYTSGHQKRVSAIAVAIASQMGLPETQVEGIRTAAVIHDIGKLSIPAEILSKPSRLTEIEFSLIKTHSQIGYDILKDIYFPWPIAQIILQHHEKLDGSGYPQGLNGGQILLEARILAVADVFEAMASHRPYRPAIGIEAALEEIENNRGILYDADAVDACTKLFRERGFELE
ncbi:MAG: PAS domain S-box protein [Syntrophorhabdaceae bacterium]|nr:PAS domain S-box protein [Syntrophorhabdaceae bacterium]